MKKLIALLVLITIVGSTSVYPASTTANVGVQATVPQMLELSSWIRYAPPGVDPYGTGSGDATSLEFGTLVYDDEFGIWTATKYFTVFLLAATSGRPYRIHQTNTGFSLGSTNLNNSLIMFPDYIAADVIYEDPQGPMPSGDSYGAPGLAMGINKIVYNGNAGKSRIARAYYGLSTGDEDKEPSGAEPITTDQVSGTYVGTITFSLVLQ